MPALSHPSYNGANVLTATKRRKLASKLEDPIRIEFIREWKGGNPLYDWYHRRVDPLIWGMQLRKERRGPWFHEYIVVALGDRDSPSYFRVDRRPCPDEEDLLNSMGAGCEAYDTIEEITSFDDSRHCASDCLIEIEFEFQVSLALLLKVCHAIHRHPASRMYTLQRYNCYFLAQTILLCMVRQGWCLSIGCQTRQRSCRGNRPLAEVLSPYVAGNDPANPMDKLKPSVQSGTHTKRSDRQQISELQAFKACRNKCELGWEDRSRRNRHLCMGMIVCVKVEHIQVSVIQYGPPNFVQNMHRLGLVIQDRKQVSYDDVQSYVERLVQTHSERVERYWFVSKSTASEVTRDIWEVIDSVWNLVRNCPLRC